MRGASTNGAPRPAGSTSPVSSTWTGSATTAVVDFGGLCGESDELLQRAVHPSKSLAMSLHAIRREQPGHYYATLLSASVIGRVQNVLIIRRVGVDPCLLPETVFVARSKGGKRGQIAFLSGGAPLLQVGTWFCLLSARVDTCTALKVTLVWRYRHDTSKWRRTRDHRGREGGRAKWDY